jgi:hypothetical protein
MKKLFLIIAIAMFSITMTQAQVSTTSWQSSDCWEGIEYRFHYSPDGGTYQVNIELRNRYKVPIKLNYDIIGDGYENRNNGVWKLGSGESRKSFVGLNITTKNLRARISGANEFGKNGSAQCDK